ncbi:MAG: MotA/TolQ/ExbB proton channel family protein [Chthoniobacter sp.]|uniref:MotA/TolQ/ExbB proton channel family protein n=1 Tax=Chthoniobacter sp. TaxID=2510640 RepID=UPI0032A2ACD7
MIHPRLRRYLPLASCVAVLLFSRAIGLAQEEGGDAKPAGGESIFDTIKNGGPLIMLIWCAIIGTSITMVTFIIQNIMSLRKNKLAPPPLIAALQQTILNGNYQEAWETCNANKNYLANVLKAGLSRLGRGKEAVEDAVAEHGLREATMLRTRNSYLSVIGVVSPMIGLLGTVIGMMGAFRVLAGSGISDPRALSGKIGEVLLATASGLFIAIPAFVSYYVFRNVSQMCIVHADDVVNSLLMDIPFDELSGVQVGENFNAGVDQGMSGGARKVSMALTTACPICNGAVTPGVNPCPHCGSTLDWQS